MVGGLAGPLVVIVAVGLGLKIKAVLEFIVRHFLTLNEDQFFMDIKFLLCQYLSKVFQYYFEHTIGFVRCWNLRGVSGLLRLPLRQ